MRPCTCTIVPTLACLLAPVAVLPALDHVVVGPRAQGMAGSTVASVNDYTAQFYNPAAFGFMARPPALIARPGEDVEELEAAPQDQGDAPAATPPADDQAAGPGGTEPAATQAPSGPVAEEATEAREPQAADAAAAAPAARREEGETAEEAAGEAQASEVEAREAEAGDPVPTPVPSEDEAALSVPTADEDLADPPARLTDERPPPATSADPDNNELGGRRLGFGADLTAHVRLTGAIAGLVEDLQDIDTVDLGSIDTTTGIDPAQIDQLTRLTALLVEVDDPGNQVQVLGTTGGGLQVGRLAVGARVFGGLSAFVSRIDLDNLGLDWPSTADLSGDMEQAAADNDILPPGYTPEHLTGAEAQRLEDAGWSPGAIAVMDFYLSDAIDDGVANSGSVSDYVDVLVSTAETTDGLNPDGGPIEDNMTTVAARGVAWFEIPVSYGHALTEHVSLGITGKYMRGRVYGMSVRVFDEESELDEVLEDALDDHEESNAIGIDLGVLARTEHFQAGLMARNINTPTFDGNVDPATGRRTPEVEIQPQVSIAGAWIPMPTLTVEATLDLLETDGVTRHYQTQYASLGAEWNVLRFLALRGGIATNLAEDDIGPTVDVGVGFNLALLRIDAAIGSALETYEYDGDEYPAEVHASLGLSSQW